MSTIGGVTGVHLTKMYVQVILFTTVLMCAKNALCISHKTELKSITVCDNPDPPYRTPNPVDFSIETYKKYRKTLIKGTVNVTQNLDNFIKYTSQTFEDGKVKVLLKLDKVSCKHVLTKIIYAAAHLNYDMDTCKVLKGNYSFDTIDVNKLDQANRFAPRLVGDNEWRVVFYGSKGAYLCLSLVVEMKV